MTRTHPITTTATDAVAALLLEPSVYAFEYVKGNPACRYIKAAAGTAPTARDYHHALSPSVLPDNWVHPTWCLSQEPEPSDSRSDWQERAENRFGYPAQSARQTGNCVKAFIRRDTSSPREVAVEAVPAMTGTGRIGVWVWCASGTSRVSITYLRGL